jgi:uncharacterized protein (DUF2062 family)
MKLWSSDAIRKLVTIEDSPESIARGIGIGVFLGFTPLYGLKTLLGLLLAVLFRGNKIAAVIGVNLHDVVLPLVPVVLGMEYDLGFWLLSRPHHLPASLDLIHLRPHEWLRWTTFFNVGMPILLGSLMMGIPFGCAAYFVTRRVLPRARRPG